MLILFDEATPLPLRPFLKGHLVRTTFQQGWAGLTNGSLIEVAEQAGFQLLLTTDRNLGYQQNLTTRRIAIVVLTRQQWPALRPYVDQVVQAVNDASPGSFTEWSSRLLSLEGSRYNRT